MGIAVVSQAAFTQAEALGVSRESWSRIEHFVDLLLTWQARINLISPASIPQIWERHVIDSLQVLPLLPKEGAVADLGSGSGFPALPLAIASGLTFHLYESNNKKAAFLREALRVTGCTGHVYAERLDGLNAKTPTVQVVTARALAPLYELLNWAEPFLQPGVRAVFHKGENLAQELTQAGKYWKIQSIEHKSLTDSKASILEITEVSRAA
jgi:16S rRNA (guanine527-N7)-methyltransferase